MTTRQIESEAERAISNGEPIIAFDILSAIEKEEYSSKCWQLLGQALANCGSPHSARTILERQYQNSPTPELCASLAHELYAEPFISAFGQQVVMHTVSEELVFLAAAAVIKGQYSNGIVIV